MVDKGVDCGMTFSIFSISFLLFLSFYSTSSLFLESTQQIQLDKCKIILKVIAKKKGFPDVSRPSARHVFPRTAGIYSIDLVLPLWLATSSSPHPHTRQTAVKRHLPDRAQRRFLQSQAWHVVFTHLTALNVIVQNFALGKHSIYVIRPAVQ